MKALRSSLVLVAMFALMLGCKKGGDQPKAEGKPAAEKQETAAAPKEAAESTKPADEKPKEATDEAAAAATEDIPAVVAKVNGVEIAADEYKAELGKITSRGAKIPPERMDRIKGNILKRLIEKELIDQEIKRQKIEVTDAEIQEAFDAYKKRFRTEEQFQNYLKHSKVTIEQIKERMRAKKALEKLVESSGNVTAGEAEAKEFYEKNERFYLEKEAVRASHILVKVAEGAPKEEIAKAQKKIAEIQAELKKGADFAEVARKYSEGPSAPKGGDLGFFSRGQMVKPFEEVAFALPADKISEPVRTRFGFHVIKVFEKREERKKPFEEVKEQILESLRNKKFFKERRSLIKKLTDTAKIEKFI